jgi:hypothetical protein
MPEFDGVIWDDRHYDCIEEAAEAILESVAELYRDEPLELWLQALPDSLPICERDYIQAPGLDSAIDVLLEGYTTDAAEVLANETICTYLYLCDDDYGFSATSESIGNLQSALDVFWSRNNILFRLFKRFQWFDPYRHGYGYRALEKALNEFAIANRHFWLYAESKLTEPLSTEFWKAELTDYLED